MDKAQLKEAIQATDAYLGIEKNAIANGIATPHMVHDFSYHFTRAHELLHMLGVLDQHEKYMSDHVAAMLKLSKHDDNTLADLPYVHVPSSHLDLEEEKNYDDFSEEDLEKMAKELEWEDIFDLYHEHELAMEKSVDEAISPASRIQRRMRFARTSSKRNLAKFLKLHRVSDVKTLQIRAQKAARRALMNKFLRGRNKALMSASEKMQIEAQVNRLKAVQQNLAIKMMPRIREIEKQRLTRR